MIRSTWKSVREFVADAIAETREEIAGNMTLRMLGGLWAAIRDTNKAIAAVDEVSPAPKDPRFLTIQELAVDWGVDEGWLTEYLRASAETLAAAGPEALFRAVADSDPRVVAAILEASPDIFGCQSKVIRWPVPMTFPRSTARNRARLARAGHHRTIPTLPALGACR